MICWCCYWGWPRPVVEIYGEAMKRLRGDTNPLDFGPGHIVWEDENFDDSVEWCLEHFDEHRNGYSEQELEVVRWSLQEMAKLPLEIRNPWPEDYDGEHPENFPPPGEMVKI